MSTLARYAPWAVLAATLAFVLSAFAILTGVWTIQPGPEEHFVDRALVMASLGHAALGTVIALLHLASGAGVLALFDRRQQLISPFLMLFGLPAGLVLLTGLALFALNGWVTVLLALVILISFAAGGTIEAARRFRAEGWSFRTPGAAVRLLLILLVPTLYGAWMGLIQHGPTQTLTAYPIMDLLYYATSIESIDLSGWPPRDLNYEGGWLNHINMVWSTIGAAVSGVPGFDPFLYVVAGSQSALFVFASTSLVQLNRIYPANAAINGILFLALLTATYFPGWISNSPSVIHALPLTVSFFVLLQQAEMRRLAGTFHWTDLLALSGMALIATALTKTVVFGLMVPLTGLWILRSWPLVPKGLKISAIILGVVFGLILVGFTVFSANFIASFLVPAPWSWIWHQNGFTGFWPILLREVSALLIAAGILRARPNFTGLGLAGLMVLSIFFPSILIVITALTGLYIAMEIRQGAHLPASALVLLTVGYALAIPKAVFGDPAGLAPAIGWIFAIGLMSVMIVGSTGKLLRNGNIRSLAALGMGVLLVAAGFGQIPVRSGYWYPVSGYEGITPDEFHIWRTARTCLPRDALVFTDQTGTEGHLDGHWNLYPQIGGRQVYIAGIGQSHGAQLRPDEIAERRALNTDVLAGTRDPETLVLGRRYGLFARIARSDPPEGWSVIHANGTFSLAVFGDAADGVNCQP